jgi:2-keto-4-pentenoate hydratase
METLILFIFKVLANKLTGIRTLKRNGEAINRGKGTDALGGQWKAALRLVNTMVKQGWKIEPGQIIITGALGRMVPGKPGNYIADYGPLGTITFKID